MSVIVICGGGGKTYISKKYNELLDIDEFIWSIKNKKYHNEILESIEKEDYNNLGEIYKTILIENKKYLQNLKKIILVHSQINAEWLDMKCLSIIKPQYNIFLHNIKNRNDKLKKTAINNWNKLNNSIQYNSYEEFETIIKKLINNNGIQ